jgi:hypothetical protein
MVETTESNAVLIKDKKIKDLFTKRLDASAKDRKDKIERDWDLLERAYNLKSNRTKPDDFICYPLVKTYAEGVYPRLVSSIFAGREFFDLRGREATDDPSNMKLLMGYQAENEMGIITKLLRLLRGVVLLGTRFASLSWDADKDCPLFTPIKNKYFYPDPTAEDIESANWIITQNPYRLDELKILGEQGIYKNIDLIETKLNLKPEDSDKTIDIYEMWINSGEVFAYAKEFDVIVRETDNPFKHKKKPFIMFRNTPIEFEFYGDPLLKPLIQLQDAKNDVQYQIRRNIDLILQGIWIGLRGAGIDWDKLQREGICLTEEMNGVRREAVENVTGAAEAASQHIDETADKVIGIYDPQRGASGGELGRTATGITLIIKESNFRFVEQVRALQTEGFKNLIEQWVGLNQQYINQKKVRRVLGEEVVIVKAEDIAGNYDYIATSTPALGNIEIMQAQAQAFFDRFEKDTEVRTRLLKADLFKMFDKDPKKYLKTEQEIAQEIAAAQAQVAAEQQAAAAARAGNIPSGTTPSIPGETSPLTPQVLPPVPPPGTIPPPPGGAV